MSLKRNYNSPLKQLTIIANNSQLLAEDKSGMAELKPPEESDDEIGYEQLQWVKLARLLLANAAEQLTAFLALLEKLLSNVIQNPVELKFRSIKSSNTTIQKKILDRNGGVEFLHALGFIVKTDPETRNQTGPSSFYDYLSPLTLSFLYSQESYIY